MSKKGKKRRGADISADPRRSAVIVGAGAAGIAAANSLAREGWVVTVLEASPRIGGRLRHLSGFADFHVELGAEEVHGNANRLPSLASLAGAKLIAHRSADDYMRCDGAILPLPAAARLRGMRETMRFMSGVSDWTGPPWSVEQAAIHSHLPRRFWHYLESRMGVEHGTSLDRLGMRGFAGYESTWQRREENYTLDLPYVDLLRPLLVPLEGRIYVGSEVESVEWSSPQPSVRLSSGASLRSSAVVYTGSLAVLRDSPPSFIPPLPPEKLEAISSIGMDGGMKVVMKFTRRFWPSNMYFLHSDTYWPQFWTPGRKRGGRDAVLTAFVGARRASFLRGLGVDLVEFGLRELDRIFGAGVATSSMLSAHVADWSSEPFVRGLYSFPLPGTTPAHRRDLAAPLGGKLFFAGEATDTGGHSGTVHGAIESGLRAASEVLLSASARPV